MPSHCLNVIIGDFNIDFFKKKFNHQYNFNLTFLENTIINDTQIDHIWTNAPIQQYHSGLAQTYWTYHKPIYSAFKLFDYVPQFVLPHNTTK
jgi:hypothetical protein